MQYTSNNFSKTQILNSESKEKTSPHSIRDSSSSIVLETKRHRLRQSGVKHVKTKIISDETRDAQTNHLAYNDYFSK